MSAGDQQLLEILKIGKETSLRGSGISVRDALTQTDYRKLRRGFESHDLVSLVIRHPELVGEWIMYSQDKRTKGGWYLLEEREIGQVEKEESRVRFNSIEEAVAEYVVRELDFWAVN